MNIPNLGLGIGWRPEIALAIERRKDLGFIEITAENFDADAPVPPAIRALKDRGVKIIVHGIGLSLGGAEPLEERRIRHFVDTVHKFGASLASEHIAFVRGAGLEAGHLLPTSRTRAALDVLIENTQQLKKHLDVPLALENISTLFEWPNNEIAEAEFIKELLDRTESALLLDIANVYANSRNLGGDGAALLDALPLRRIAYVHMGGGEEREGVYYDSHAQAVPEGAFQLLEMLCTRRKLPGAMLERDDHYPPEHELNTELDRIATIMRGSARMRSFVPSGLWEGKSVE